MTDVERHKFLSEQVRVYQGLIAAMEQAHPGLADMHPETDEARMQLFRQLEGYKSSLKTLQALIAELESRMG